MDAAYKQGNDAAKANTQSFNTGKTIDRSV
jgi:hypothetical protein